MFDYNGDEEVIFCFFTIKVTRFFRGVRQNRKIVQNIFRARHSINMLSDVGNLWLSASSALAQALEKLDNDLNSGKEEKGNLDQVQQDLDAYKKLLDDAQMQHLELSKQSRLLIAEKDVEIKHLKNLVESSGGSLVSTQPQTAESNLLFQKVLSEKLVLESSLREVEDQLRDAIRAKNELQSLTKSYDELRRRFEIMRDEFVAYRTDADSKERQRTETIENLVSEYSRLASEAEANRQKSDVRVSSVLKENEILVTKMHALEHSIAELADRTSAPSPKRESSSDSLSAAITAELKAKIVNLLYDLKQKEDEVAKLQKNGNENVSSLLKKLQTAEEDVAQWITMADRYQLEAKSLQAQLITASSAAVTSSDNNAAVEVFKQQLQTQQATFESEISKLQNTLLTKAEEVATTFNEKTKLLSELQLLQSQQTNFETELSKLQNTLRVKEEEFVTVNDEKSRLVSELQQLQTAKELEKSQFLTQIEVLTSSSNADKDSATKELLMQIQSVQDQLSAQQKASLEQEQRFQQEKSDLTAELRKRFTDEKIEFSSQFDVKLDDLENQHKVALSESQASHEKELLSKMAEVERCKNEEITQLTTQHADAMKAEIESQLTNLRATLTQEHEANLQAQRNQLEADFTTEKTRVLQECEENVTLKVTISVTEKLQGEHEAAAKLLKEEFQVEKAAAIDMTLQQAKVELQAALETLTQEKNQEKEKSLEQLTFAKEEERNRDLAIKQVKFDQEIATLQAEKEQAIAQLQEQISSLQSQLLKIEILHQTKLETALQTLEAMKNDEKLVAVKLAKDEMQALVTQANAERDEYMANYTKERQLRKKIHNKLLEIQGNIRVICRVRPISEVERRSGEDVDVTEIPTEDEIFIKRDVNSKQRYEYDRVFGQVSTQEEVFEAVQPLCISVLDGYNVCIFAYGQTGSGKTYTMEGYGDNIGVSPRAINELFNQLRERADEWTFTLTLSMLEIYNETIHDLLNNNNGAKMEKEKLDVRQTPEGNQVVGLTDVPITNMEQVKELMRQGQNNRAVGKHDMNEHSSRSHSILTLTARGRNRIDNATTYGKLHLIDLAGSERLSKTDASGDRLKEAQNINKSLLALGDVINALGNKKATHVPYRNSKLTFLLQDSLGGNSKVMTFVNVSPAVYNMGETICSLNFATRCRSTELGQAKKQSAEAGAGGASTAGGGLERKRSALMAQTSVSSSAVLSPSASSSNLLASSVKKA